MRHPRLAFASTVVSFLALTGTALAQEPAADEAPAEPAAAPPEAAPPAAPAETAPPAPVEEAPAVAPLEAAPAEPSSIPGWFRIDSDGLGLQLWAGATHSVGGIDIATDMYVGYDAAAGSYGEFDIGPAFTVADGQLVITPMIGLGVNWTAKKASAIVPQLFFIGGFGPVYFESWWQFFIQKPFDDEAVNFLYSRDFITVDVVPDFGIGVGAEPTFGIGDGQDTITSLPVGGVAKLAYGEGATFFAFLGYETQEGARTVDDAGLAGRLTFVKNF
jgi:hypothetical protein